MRNNHDKKNHKLVKRAFALCLALAVICSCLLPVFATEGVIMPMIGGQEAATQEGGIAVGPAVEVPTEQKPVTGGDTTAATPTLPEGATDYVDNGDGTYTYKDAAGNTVKGYFTGDKTTWSGDEITITPNPDLKSDDAAFGVTPIEYHFWLKQMDNFDLSDLAWEAEMSNQSETEYLVMYGYSKKFPIWHMDTISSNDTISNYQFDDPTSLNDPEGLGREFAGWYTVDSTGLKHEFDPYQSYGSTSNTVINVFAAWKDASGDVVDDTKKDEETKEEDTKKEEEKTETKTVSTEAAVYGSEDKVTVTVEGVPASVTHLSVTSMGDTSMQNFYNLYTQQGGKLALFMGFKISLKDAAGNNVQPDGFVSVTISGLKDMGLEVLTGLKVLHQTADYTIETRDTLYDSEAGTLNFLTSSFSPFVIASANGNEASTLEITIAGNAEIASGGKVTLTSNESSTVYNNSWSCEDDYSSLLELSDKQNKSVVVTAQKANAQDTKVTVKHAYQVYVNTNGSWALENRVERYTVVVKGTSSTSGQGHWVYLYVKTDAASAKQLGLVVNDSGWFTVGKVYVPTMDEPTSPLVNYGASKGNPHLYNTSVSGTDSTGQTYSYDGANWSKVVDETTGKLIGNVERYTQNTNVLLDNVQWSYGWDEGKNEYGLIAGNGADNYVSNKTWTPEWHLDGYLVTQGKVVIRHWAIDDNGMAHEIKDEEQSVPGAIGTVVKAEGHQLDSVSYNNEDYAFDHFGNPTEQTIAKDVKYLDIYYKRNTSSLTISKSVTGLLGDKKADFNFTLYVKSGVNTNKVTVTKVATDTGTVIEPEAKLGQPGDYVQKGTDWYAPYSFTLKDNQSVIFKNLPTGSYYVDEDDYSAQSYKTSYKIGDNNAVGGYSAIIALSNKGATVVFTNDRDIDVDSGVLLDTLPYIVILAVVVGGGVLLMMRKRRKEDDE